MSKKWKIDPRTWAMFCRAWAEMTDEQRRAYLDALKRTDWLDEETPELYA